MNQFRKQLTRFVVVGITSTLLNFLIYFFCYQLGIDMVMSAVLGYMTGLLNSYYLGQIWVFEINENTKWSTPLRFAVVYAVGGCSMSYIITFFNQMFELDYRICWLLGTTFAFANNFIGSKWFVFNSSRSKSGI